MIMKYPAAFIGAAGPERMDRNIQLGNRKSHRNTFRNICHKQQNVINDFTAVAVD